MVFFERFASKTKSEVILGYQKLFYSTLNQQSYQSIRIFFILCLVSIHSRVWESFSFYSWSAVIPKHEKILFSEKIKIFFQGRFFCFSGLELESVPGSPYIKYTWCGRFMEMPSLLYVSKQFCHQEIRWNYGILHTVTSYSLEYYGSFVQVRKSGRRRQLLIDI